MMKKKIIALTIAIVLMLSLTTIASAANKTTKGTWSRGTPTVDVLPPYSGTFTDIYGNVTILTESPITTTNKIGAEEIQSGVVGTNNWVSGSYMYVYNNGSYNQTLGYGEAYHYLVGKTQVYNGSAYPQTLTYSQAQAVTSSWSVSANISSTAELKQNFFNKLSATLGLSYTTSNQTSNSTSILTTIQVAPNKTGWIKAWLPGGYSYGTAKYSKWMIVPGNPSIFMGTVTQTEYGWAPLNNKSVYALNFTSGTY